MPCNRKSEYLSHIVTEKRKSEQTLRQRIIVKTFASLGLSNKISDDVSEVTLSVNINRQSVWLFSERR